MEKYEALKKILADMENDVQKFYGGNNAAGTRVRKALQELKKAAQDLRNDVQARRKESN